LVALNKAVLLSISCFSTKVNVQDCKQLLIDRKHLLFEVLQTSCYVVKRKCYVLQILSL